MRLELTQPDGASFFTRHFGYCPGDLPALPDFATTLRKLAVHSSFNLIGALFGFQVHLVDRVMVALCAAIALEEGINPHIAAERGIVRVIDWLAAGDYDDYLRLVVFGIITRYGDPSYHRPGFRPNMLFIVAIFQQLQLPFAMGYFCGGVPVPLHHYPMLQPGCYVTSYPLDSKPRYFHPLGRGRWMPETTRQRRFHDAFIWVLIMNRLHLDGDGCSLSILRNVSRLHKYLFDSWWTLGWNAERIARKAVDFLMQT